MHTALFFFLQVIVGMATILESKAFECEEEKEIGVAGVSYLFHLPTDFIYKPLYLSLTSK